MSLKLAISLVLLTVVAAGSVFADSFRPPAVPLVTNNPYLSIWSESDKLTDTNTVH